MIATRIFWLISSSGCLTRMSNVGLGADQVGRRPSGHEVDQYEAPRTPRRQERQVKTIERDDSRTELECALIRHFFLGVLGASASLARRLPITRHLLIFRAE